MKKDSKETLNPDWLVLPEVTDPWGNLCFGQSQQSFPFVIERVYYIYGIPAQANRGGHAHRKNREAIFCLQGECTLWLYTKDGQEKTYRLDHPARGVFIPEMWWVELSEYNDNTLTLVAASRPYQESDYIRNPEDFFLVEPFPDPVYRPRS